jgi:hypothetical protein
MCAYRHTQPGPLCLLFFATALTSFLLTLLPGGVPALRIIFPILGLLMLVLGASVQTLTVADEGDRLAVWFGPLPLFQQRIRYDEIRDVEIGRTSLLDGWGIHMSRGGYVWNIWGRDCVVIRTDRQVLRIGTDDAENLAQFLLWRAGGKESRAQSDEGKKARVHNTASGPRVTP